MTTGDGDAIFETRDHSPMELRASAQQWVGSVVRSASSVSTEQVTAQVEPVVRGGAELPDEIEALRAPIAKKGEDSRRAGEEVASLKAQHQAWLAQKTWTGKVRPEALAQAKAVRAKMQRISETMRGDTAAMRQRCGRRSPGCRR